MKDMLTHLEKLQVQVAECEMIRDLATDPKKRELFARLAEHFKTLAAQLEQAIAAHNASGFLQPSPQAPPPNEEDGA